MSQIQMANMYGLGDATSRPWIVLTPEAFIYESNLSQMSFSDAAWLAIRSSFAITLAGAAVGALGARLIGGKRRMVTGALLGAGVGQTYSSFQLLPFVQSTTPEGAGVKLGGWAIAAATLGYGAYRLWKGR